MNSKDSTDHRTPPTWLVALGVLVASGAAISWSLMGPIIEAVHAGSLPGAFGDLLAPFMQQRSARTAADYIEQMRSIVGPHLILLAGSGAIPLALRLDAHRDRSTSHPLGPTRHLTTTAVALLTTGALFVSAGPRFALHATAGLALVVALRRLALSAPDPVEVEGESLLVGPAWRRWEPWSIAGVVALAAAMRLPRIGLLDPYTDEYYHLMAAQELLTAGSTDYQRAPLVTLLVALAFAVSGATGFEQLISVARIPFALAGALTVIPVVLIGRRIDRTIAIVSGLLWAVSPWAIDVSRTVREYALYPLLALTFALALMTLARRDAMPAVRGVAAVFGAAFLAYLVLDRSSTLAVGAVPALIATVVAFGVDLNRSRVPRPASGRAAIIAVVAVVATSIVLLVRTAGTPIGLSIRPEYLRVFLAGDGSPLHWWGPQGATPLFVLLVLLTGGVAARATGTLHRSLPVLTATVLPLLGLVVLLDRYFSARYSSALLPWFTLLIAGSIVAIVRLVRPAGDRPDAPLSRSTRGAAAAAAALLLVAALRPVDAVVAIWSTDHGERLTTGEFHDPVRDMLVTHGHGLSATPALVTVEHLARAMQVAGIRAFDDSHHYRYRDPERFDDAAAVMRQHSEGLILLDARRNGGWTTGYPRSSFTVDGHPTIAVDLLSDDGFLQLYRWSISATADMELKR